MKLEIIFIAILCLYCPFEINAQILENTKTGYKFGNSHFKTDKAILEILDKSPLAVIAYLDSKSNQKKAEIYGLTSLTSLVLSGIFIIDGASSNSADPKPLPLVTGIGFGLVGCITGLVGISYKTKSNFEKNTKVISLYNDEVFGMKSSYPRFGSGIRIENGVTFYVVF